jgi:DNA-binding LacI/PurR family transcriptional regulator
VPGEVAVVGFDGIYPACLVDPPDHSSSAHALAGRAGLRPAARRIAYPSIRPTVELLPTELILRSSCGCPPGTQTRRAVKTLKPAHVNP